MTFWLSFTDPDRPRGKQFLGVAVVDVTNEDMVAATPAVLVRRAALNLPPPPDDTYWLAGAIRNAHQTGCNPGGEVASIRIDTLPGFATYGPRYPRGRLLSRDEIAAAESDSERQGSR